MAADDSKPKRSGLGWIPKLSLWAVVIAFGYLYLSSIERDSTGDSAQLAIADHGATSAGARAGVGAEADGGGLPQQLMGKLDELTSSAGTLIGNATTAGSDMFKDALDKVKDLAGMSDEPVTEVAAAETSVAEPTSAQPAVVETPVVATQPTPLAPAVAVERPSVSAFDRHSAPLPSASVMRSVGQAPEAAVSVDAPATAVADAAPVADTEASVFAESLMQNETTAAEAPATVTPATEATTLTPPAPAMGYQPAPLMPVHPLPFGRAGTMTETMPASEAIEAQQAAAAEYRARMMADYENRRRLADQRAREYWESMQGAQRQLEPPVGYPAYAPGYAPGYGPSAFQR